MQTRKTGRRPMESASRPQKKPAKIEPRLNAEPRYPARNPYWCGSSSGRYLLRRGMCKSQSSQAFD